MPGHDIIVMGASAGGVETLTRLVRGLPADLPAALFVVLHVRSHGTSVLPHILGRAGALPAVHPVDGEEIHPGKIYVAPPDHHLLIRPGRIRLARGPRENGLRPAVDPLFRSAARSYGRRVVGVVLSGALDDGTAGLVAIKQRGGVAVVQDPDEALYPGMPRSAAAHVDVDHLVRVSEVAPVLIRLAYESVNEEFPESVPDEMEKEADFAELDLDVLNSPKHPGVPAGFGCPDCGGALWEIGDAAVIRFRCRIGHAWSQASLLARQAEALETALWTAMRALEESAALADRMAERLRKRNLSASVTRFERQASEARGRAAVIRQVLLHEGAITDAEVGAEASPSRLDSSDKSPA